MQTQEPLLTEQELTVLQTVQERHHEEIRITTDIRKQTIINMEALERVLFLLHILYNKHIINITLLSLD